jgi:hypothetical protein
MPPRRSFPRELIYNMLPYTRNLGCFRFAPNGIPRKGKGIEPIKQLRYFAIASKDSCRILKSNNLLYKKLASVLILVRNI